MVAFIPPVYLWLQTVSRSSNDCGRALDAFSQHLNAMSIASIGYDFTEIYNQTHNHVCFSPGTQFILTAVQDRIVVRRSDTFQIARTWLLDNAPCSSSTILAAGKQPMKSKKSVDSEGWITHLGWSSDSEHILATCAKRGVVHIFKMRDDTWHAEIEAGVEGLAKAEWSPDGRHVLCFSEWGVRISLVTKLEIYSALQVASSDNMVPCDRICHVCTISQVHR